jgi:tetratricopeptide (TPR) repeat protein
MKYLLNTLLQLFYILSMAALISCNGNNSIPSKELIKQIDLKRGNVISCGSTDKQLGSVDFDMTCNEKAKKDFNLAIELLHSFEYDESEKVFAKVIDETPGCAMAYWGVAMCNFHPLWTPPTEAELQKGSKAIEIANTISKKSERESAYINAIAIFYKDWNKTDHHTRCINYEKAMEKIHTTYPDDKEASIFYALSLDASANPNDKTYTNQKKAGSILNALYPSEPNHPGIIHYIIHTYDYPGLAELALPAARKYAAIAPNSAHALHMPSHTFTRLGLWDECIKSNLASVASAKCYAEQAGIKGHWDEELHGLDYLMYAYLQKGENKLANEQLTYLETIREVHPANFKVAYAFAAIPARFLLENKNWYRAATLQMAPANFSWIQFPWQESIIHFTRLLGAAHLGKIKNANIELEKLKLLHDTLEQQKDAYKSQQVAIQIKTGEAWIQFAKEKTTVALNLMKLAADMEDGTEKHPVTPGEVLPARELLGDMLLQIKQYEDALLAYEAVLQKCPNRFNSLYGAGVAAEKSGQKQKAVFYFKQLLTITDTLKSDRPELVDARIFLAMQ